MAEIPHALKQGPSLTKSKFERLNNICAQSDEGPFQFLASMFAFTS